MTFKRLHTVRMRHWAERLEVDLHWAVASRSCSSPRSSTRCAFVRGGNGGRGAGIDCSEGRLSSANVGPEGAPVRRAQWALAELDTSAAPVLQAVSRRSRPGGDPYPGSDESDIADWTVVHDEGRAQVAKGGDDLSDWNGSCPSKLRHGPTIRPPFDRDALAPFEVTKAESACQRRLPCFIGTLRGCCRHFPRPATCSPGRPGQWTCVLVQRQQCPRSGVSGTTGATQLPRGERAGRCHQEVESPATNGFYQLPGRCWHGRIDRIFIFFTARRRTLVFGQRLPGTRQRTAGLVSGSQSELRRF